MAHIIADKDMLFIDHCEPRYLYLCNGDKTCGGKRGCIFWNGVNYGNEDDNYHCKYTVGIEYSKHKDKFKEQLLDGSFPHEDEWEQKGKVFVEKEPK